MKGTKKLKAAGLVAAVIFLFSAGWAMAGGDPNLPEQRDPNQWHLGEDGTWHPLFAGQDRSGWMLGKIHPEVAGRAPGTGPLEIKIQLVHQPLPKIAEQVRTRRQDELHFYENELKLFMEESLPIMDLMTRDEEVETLAQMQDPAPLVRENINVLHEEIERVQSGMTDEIVTKVAEKVDPDLEAVANLVASLGGEVRAAGVLSNLLGAVFQSWDETTLTALAQSPLVASITPDAKMELDLNVSADMLGADSFWNDAAVYDGGIWDFGLCDSGVLATHDYLDSHPIYKRYPSSVGYHGTSVAGIVASTHPTYKGIAYGVDKIINGAGHNSMAESECFENQDWVIDTSQHGNDGPEVINNSYSLYDHTDEYGDFERYMDSIVSDLNIQVTKSAGNRGPGYGGLQQLGYPQSHNLISVANLDIKNTVTTTDDVITHEFSSRGPTDSNRRKPDLAAPGTGTGTTTDSSDTAMTTTFGGTSAAAPHVAAACLLLRDAGISNVMAQKAILLNTATTWSDGDTLDVYGDDGPVDGDRWDNTYGWGVLDLGHAYIHRSDYHSGSVVGNNNTSADDDYKLFKGTMYANDKVTMVWHRRAVFNDDLAPTTYYTLTDLNLRLYDETTGSTLDSDLDGNDNVHQVSVDGTHQVVVKAYAWSSNIYGQTTEPFILATEENFSAAEPPSFQNNYSRPNYVGPYQTFDVTVRIFNNGDVAAHNNSLTLSNISGIIVNGGNTQSIDSVEPGPYPNNPQVTTYSLTTSGAAAGTHWLPVSFESSCYAETFTYSTTNGVSLIVERDAPVTTCTAPAYANSEPIAVNWTATDAGCGMGTSYLYVKGPGQTQYYYAGLNSTASSGTFNYMPEGGDGTYYFAIRSVDRGGNWEPIPTAAEDSTMYDTVAPGSSLSSPAAVAGGSIVLSFTTWDAAPSSGVQMAYFYYKKGLDDSWHFIQNTTALSGTINFTPSGGSGTYYFSMKARDNAGNYQYGPGYPPSPSCRTVYGSPCGGDCNGDGSCNLADLARMGENWLGTGCTYPMKCGGADLNGSGNVDNYDFRYVLRNYNCTE